MAYDIKEIVILNSSKREYVIWNIKHPDGRSVKEALYYCQVIRHGKPFGASRVFTADQITKKP